MIHIPGLVESTECIHKLTDWFIMQFTSGGSISGDSLICICSVPGSICLSSLHECLWNGEYCHGISNMLQDTTVLTSHTVLKTNIMTTGMEVPRSARHYVGGFDYLEVKQ